MNASLNRRIIGWVSATALVLSSAGPLWARPGMPQKPYGPAWFLPDGKTALIQYEDQMQVWDLTDLRRLGAFNLSSDGVPRAQNGWGPYEYLPTRLSRNGKTLVYVGKRGTIFVVDVAGCKQIKEIKTSAVPISTAQISPDAKYVLIGRDNATAELWNLDTGRSKRVPPSSPAPVSAAQFTPDCKQVLIGRGDGIFELWDVEKAKKVRAWRFDKNAPFYRADCLLTRWQASPVAQPVGG